MRQPPVARQDRKSSAMRSFGAITKWVIVAWGITFRLVQRAAQRRHGLVLVFYRPPFGHVRC